MAKLLFGFLWTDMKQRSIKTKKKEREEGREKRGERENGISIQPIFDRTGAYLIECSSYGNTKSVLVELSRQSRGANKIGPAWVGNKNTTFQTFGCFYPSIISPEPVTQRFPFPVEAFLMICIAKENSTYLWLQFRLNKLMKVKSMMTSRITEQNPDRGSTEKINWTAVRARLAYHIQESSILDTVRS